jgi:hypothetical protein
MENKDNFEIKNFNDLFFIKVGMLFGTELNGAIGEILDFESQENPIADGNGDTIVTNIKFKLLENEEICNFTPHVFIAFVKGYKFIQPTEIEVEKEKIEFNPLDTSNYGMNPIYDSENETPKHYKNEKEYDVIDIANDYKLNFNRGSAVKYVCRAGKKDDEIQDLKKAVDFLQREIKFLELEKK